LDAGQAGVGDDDALGGHAGVVGEDAGVEGGRVVAPEPCGLVDGDREGGGVGLAEAEAAERGDYLPDPLDRRRVEVAGKGPGAEPWGGAVRAALFGQVA